MRSNRWIAFSSLVAALVAAPLSLGCGPLGDRARDGCPAGETCSTATPGGLAFEGRGIGGTLTFGSLHPTAIGGTQRVTFRTAVSSESLPPFAVETAEPTTVSIASREGTSVSLLGVASGSTMLRVTDTTDGSLVDRITVSSAAIADARLDALDLVIALAPDPAPVAALAGQTDLFVHLVAADGTLLVDDSLVLGAASGEYTTNGWDGVSVVDATDTFGLDVTAGGRVLHADVRIVDAIDDLVVADWLLSEDASGATTVDAGGLFCVVAMADDARVAGGPGATFVVDGTAIAHEDGDMTNCTTLPSHLGATVTIAATLLGVTRSFTLTVGERDASSSLRLAAAPATFADLRPRAHVLGERAVAPSF